jgi:hypothetical protein
VGLSSYRHLLRRDGSAILGDVTLPSPCKRALAAVACIATLLITACGPAKVTVTPSSSTSATAAPTAAAQPFAGAGFRTNIPAGWQDETSNQSALASLSGTGTVLMLLASPDHGVIVVRITPQPVADDQLAQYLTSITAVGATGVSPAEPVNVDGVSGVLVTYLVTPAGGAGQETEAMVLNQAGNTYEIALTTAQADFSQDATGLQEVLDTWTWG